MQNLNSQEYWAYFIDFIAPEFDQGVLDIVIAPNKFISFESGLFTLLSPSQTIKKLINNQFKTKLEVLMMSQSGKKVEIKAILANETDQTMNLQKNKLTSVINRFDITGGYSLGSSGMEELQNKYSEIYKPDKNFLFENFVVGESNKIAAKAANVFFKTAEARVLFIYGNSGLGKTHLISALANQALIENKKVAYMQANEFVQQYTGALGHLGLFSNSPNTIDEFVTILNSVDLLVIDDIQGFNGKAESSGTFFNIFNHLRKNGKKIVLAADVPPEALAGIPKRLITRFNQGLVLKILKPSTELSIKFLEGKITRTFSETPDLKVAQEVYDALALHFGSDFRTLQGVVNKLNFCTTIHPTSFIGPQYLSKHILGDAVTQEKIKGEKIKRIVASEYHLINEDQLIGKARKTPIKEARHLAVWLFRKHLDLSYKQIGKVFGDRDHSTIMHSEKKVNEKMKNNSQYKEFVLEVERKIKT